MHAYLFTHYFEHNSCLLSPAKNKEHNVLSRVYFITERKASFLGQLPTTTDGRTNVPKQAPIRFSEVFDLGNGFNPVTGVYTAKYSGVYVINFQIFPYFTNVDFLVDLKMNGNILVRSRATENPTYSASVSSGVSVRVRIGDQLWVETSREDMYWGSVHSFLSITLVTPEA